MLKYANKLVSVLLALIVFSSILAGCSGKDFSASTQSESSEPLSEQPATELESAVEAKPIIRIGALKGPTAMGLVPLMEENEKEESENIYEFALAGTPDEMVGKIINGELDLAAVPTNLASVLYNKTEKQVRVLAVNTLGMLNILTRGEDIASIEDLKGKTIYATGQGATPEYVLNYVLSKNNMTPNEDVTIEYFSEHTELASKMLSGSAPIALLPQPFATTVTSKDKDVQVALDLTEEWKGVSGGTDLVMGCVIARNAFLETNPEAIKRFLKEYKASTDYVNKNVEKAAAMVGKYEILPEEIAKKAIPVSNIVYQDGEEMKSSMQAFLQVLFDQNPASVGGNVPDDAFYYHAQ